MGMFDEVYIDTTMLPEPADVQEILSKASFQTKSLDNELTEIFIKSDGSLTRMMYHYEEKPDRKSAFGSIRLIEDGEETLSLTGTIIFYAYAYGVWYEYEATFIEGKLQNIIKK